MGHAGTDFDAWTEPRRCRARHWRDIATRDTPIRKPLRELAFPRKKPRRRTWACSVNPRVGGFRFGGKQVEGAALVSNTWKNAGYLYGEAVDQLFAQEDLSKTLGDAARNLWPLVDHLGTVRDLAKQDGTIAVHYQYDSFGNVTSGDTSQTRYLFTSREFDVATDLQYNRARWYDAEVGRWISEDPIGFVAGDANVARYVGNGVTGAADPSGLQNPGIDSRVRGLMHLVREGIPRSRTRLVGAIPGVTIRDSGLGAGTPVRPWGDGRHINIGGEKENPHFVDVDLPPGHGPSYVKGYERPFAAELPAGSVSHVVIRNTQTNSDTWRAIIRLKEDHAVVTIAGPKDYVGKIYDDLKDGLILENVVSITRPQSTQLPNRAIPDGQFAGYSSVPAVVFSVLLGPDTRLHEREW